MTPAMPAHTPSGRLTRALHVFLFAGLAAVAVGAAVTPVRVWANVLVALYLMVGFASAGAVFVATQYVVGASWSVAFRRVPEAMAAVLPAAAVLLAVVLATQSWLYPWTRNHGEVEGFKHWWLNRPFFLARAVAFLSAWTALASAVVRGSRQQDRERGRAMTGRNVRRSAWFLVVFGATYWLASYDWVMSIEPEWYSTIFGIYNFAGLFSGGLALLILLVVAMETTGPLRGAVTVEHYHDLGKLLFGFSTFWMYVWFCQYMLIWYANIPEETVYFIRRQRPFWEPLFLLNMLLNWAVPFLILLSRQAKRNPRTLVKAAAITLVGRWLDVYLMIVPPLAGERPWFGIWELAITLGLAGLFLLLFLRAFRQAAPVPLGDPALAESLHYHN